MGVDVSTQITLAAWVVALLGGTVTPLLTGLITKLEAHPGTKAFVALVIAAFIAVIDAITLAQGTFVVQDMIILFTVTFVMHVSTYYGFWKPVGSGAAPGARATAAMGVG